MIAPARATSRRLRLRAGIPMDQAIHEALDGADSAWITLAGARGDLSFVLPDRASDGVHGAWYSPTQRLPDATIHRAGVIWGRREGRGFGHCHGLWGATMGHLLLPQSRLSAPVDAEALMLSGARFDAEDDAETAFTLFKPRALADLAEPDAALVRLAPHLELSEGLSAALARLGWSAARLQGIGSLNTARLEDGHLLDSHATEFLLRPGRISPAMTQPGLDIVGVGGVRAAGRLAARGNAICVTAELILTRG